MTRPVYQCEACGVRFALHEIHVCRGRALRRLRELHAKSPALLALALVAAGIVGVLLLKGEAMVLDLLLTLALYGFVAFFIVAYIPMPPAAQTLIYAVVAIVMLLMVLQAFGVAAGPSVPRLHLFSTVRQS